MCPASRWTTTPSGIRHPDKMTFRSEPSALTERIRPTLASRKNNRPCVSFADVRFSFEISVSLILFISMPWVSYPFLKLSKSDISENVERDLISYAAFAGAAGFAMTPLALSRSISFNSNPSSLKTSSLCSPSPGLALPRTFATPCT